MGVNAAGLRSKMTSFKNVLSELKPAVFCIEETKHKDEGRFKIPNYVIFEHVRQSRDGGGGLALGCMEELQPTLVRTGGDTVEAISVDIFLKNINIRCCVAYGCQESDPIEKKEAFWNYLYEEIELAEQSNSGFILHFDGNLWAGNDIIPGDPKMQNRNGKFFENFLKENQSLTVVNSLEICQGLITRARNKNGKEEKSVLDFFVVCNKILPYVKNMVIDEKKEFILTNYEHARFNGKVTETDHYTQYIDLDLEMENMKKERVEIFDFKKKQSQEKFKEITSNTTKFTRCFDSKLPLHIQIQNWRQLLNSSCKEAFTKIRIKQKKPLVVNKEISNLIKKRNKLQLFYKDKKIDDINVINKRISEIEAEQNRSKILKNFKFYSENPENINMSKMWKILKKMWPKHSSHQAAKRNHAGKIVSRPSEIKELLAKEYRERLRLRPMRPDMTSVIDRKNEIFDMKIKISEEKKSPDWTLKDLDEALKNLKNDKARDVEGYANEIFKEKVIGSNLKESLLIMFNRLKRENYVPEFLNFANITTVPKKGSSLDLNNERGIFRVSVIRNILMNLIYESKYYEIDKRMSDYQMGGRRNKGCKNNLFIINGIIHEVMRSKKNTPLVIQFYDYKQMFDSINLKEAINDVFDAGLDDNNLNILYKANRNINMAIKTANGLTNRQTVHDIVLQGDKFGSLLASVQVEKIGQQCMEAGYNYLYKNTLPVGFLGMVDDIACITEAGVKANLLNSFLNVKTAEKTLQFGHKKCQYMIVGKCSQFISQQNLKVDHWKIEYIKNKISGDYDLFESYDGKKDILKTDEYKYLGFVISSTGSNMANIKEMKKKSIGVIRKIISKLQGLNLNQYFFECAVILMNVMLRGTILYAADIYYGLKENEYRQLERIEEDFLRKIIKSTKGCPVTNLYLEFGLMPAIFEIIKMRLLFLKYILEQPYESSIRKMFNLQIEKPVPGDWAGTCLRDLENMDLKMTFEEIKSIPKRKYLKIIKEKLKESARKYLLNKQGKKGSDISFSCLEMSQYLQPFNNKLTIEQKREMFSIRNKMLKIPVNFSSNCEEKCICGEKEEMSHIYECKILCENEEPTIPYTKIYNGNLKEQIMVYQKFSKNMKIREQKKEQCHLRGQYDPRSLYSKG